MRRNGLSRRDFFDCFTIGGSDMSTIGCRWTALEVDKQDGRRVDMQNWFIGHHIILFLLKNSANPSSQLVLH